MITCCTIGVERRTLVTDIIFLFQMSIPNAFDMLLTGKQIRSDKAKKMGIVDEVVKSLGTVINSYKNRF